MSPDDRSLRTTGAKTREEQDIEAVARGLRASLGDPDTGPYLDRLVGAAMGDEASIAAEGVREPVLSR